LLKRGGFKPSGRNKPASEYLAQAAREGRFPRINNLVDINNLLSLETGLPISILDLRAFAGGVCLRRGKAGEKYVFNGAGQEIELEGLICACGGEGGEQSVPLGNPVKDSMAGKLKADTADVLGVIYASLSCEAGRGITAHIDRLGALLKEFGKAATVSTSVLRL
jgi:DNA/RNA-binding domain of Phe-tRNA-synthetase-like protein